MVHRVHCFKIGTVQVFLPEQNPLLLQVQGQPLTTAEYASACLRGEWVNK